MELPSSNTESRRITGMFLNSCLPYGSLVGTSLILIVFCYILYLHPYIFPFLSAINVVVASLPISKLCWVLLTWRGNMIKFLLVMLVEDKETLAHEDQVKK